MKLSPIRRRSRGAARGAGRRRNKIPDHPLAFRRLDSHGVAIAAHRSSPQTSRVVEDAGHGRGREETRRAIRLASLRTRRRPRHQPRTRSRALWLRVLAAEGGRTAHRHRPETLPSHQRRLLVLAAEGGPAVHRHRRETLPSHQRRLRGPMSRAADREQKARFRRAP
jgi:hypothetical protein